MVLHLGDHDPSGWDATRAQHEVMVSFIEGDLQASYEAPAVQEMLSRFEFRRIGLNLDQAQTLALPPNLVKDRDSRTPGYIRHMVQAGAENPRFCWEIDALTPPQINEFLEEAVAPLIDAAEWERAIDRERAERDELAAVAARWPEVLDLTQGGPAERQGE